MHELKIRGRRDSAIDLAHIGSRFSEKELRKILLNREHKEKFVLRKAELDTMIKWLGKLK